MVCLLKTKETNYGSKAQQRRYRCLLTKSGYVTACKMSKPSPTRSKKNGFRQKLRPVFQTLSLLFHAPKLIPQFADALDIVQDAKNIGNFNICALMPNLKGAERGIEAGVDQLNYVTSVSETHNLQNVRRSPAQSVEDFKSIVEYRDRKAEETGKRVTLLAGCATAFGCTLEGDIASASVVSLAQDFVSAGADEISLADTVGYANPKKIKTLCGGVRGGRCSHNYSCTIHVAWYCTFAAYEAGIRRFDGCLAVVCGAPGATGNVVLEDMALCSRVWGCVQELI